MKVDRFLLSGAVELLEDRDGKRWRTTRNPGSDISDLPEELQQELRSFWTEEVVARWEASLPPEEKVPDLSLEGPTLKERVARLEQERLPQRVRELENKRP